MEYFKDTQFGINAFMLALQRAQQENLHIDQKALIESGLDTPEAPKPRPFKKSEPILVGGNVSTRKKPEFLLKPHLTNRPFKDNEALAKLKTSLLEATSNANK